MMNVFKSGKKLLKKGIGKGTGLIKKVAGKGVDLFKKAAGFGGSLVHKATGAISFMPAITNFVNKGV